MRTCTSWVEACNMVLSSQASFILLSFRVCACCKNRAGIGILWNPTRRVRVLDKLWCLSTSKTILTILKKDHYGRKYREHLVAQLMNTPYVLCPWIVLPEKCVFIGRFSRTQYPILSLNLHMILLLLLMVNTSSKGVNV